MFQANATDAGVGDGVARGGLVGSVPYRSHDGDGAGLLRLEAVESRRFAWPLERRSGRSVFSRFVALTSSTLIRAMASRTAAITLKPFTATSVIGLYGFGRATAGGGAFAASNGPSALKDDDGPTEGLVSIAPGGALTVCSLLLQARSCAFRSPSVSTQTQNGRGDPCAKASG